MSILSTDEPKNLKYVPVQWNQGGSGGAGTSECDGKVKMSSTSQKKYLSDLVDKDTIKIKSGKLYADIQGSDSKFTRDENIKVTVGGVTAGKYNPYEKTTSQILEDVFYPYVQFTVGDLKCNVPVLQEAKKPLTSIRLEITVSKKDKDIQSVKFYMGTTLLNTISDKPAGGTYSYNYICNISTNTTFKAVITDGVKTVTKELKISFAKKSYYGVISETAEITADLIKTLTSSVIGKKEFSYVDLTVANQRILYAYPSDFGKLTSILDDNNFEYIDSYILSTIEIDGTNYNVYVLESPVTISDSLQVYK